MELESLSSKDLIHRGGSRLDCAIQFTQYASHSFTEDLISYVFCGRCYPGLPPDRYSQSAAG